MELASDNHKNENPGTNNHVEDRPIGELFADAGARVVWSALMKLDRGAQFEVLKRLGDALATDEGGIAKNESAPDRRAAVAIRALREATKLLEEEGSGKLLGVKVYRRLRSEHPEMDWPSDGNIRRWLGGSWNDALRQAHLDPVPDGDALVVEQTGPVSKAEVLEAIRSYLEETMDESPAMWRYMAWARRSDVRSRPGRRPLSIAPFQRLFGGWNGAFAAYLQMLEAEDGDPDPDYGDAPSWEKQRPSMIVPRSRTGYSESDVFEALQDVTKRLGQVPRMQEYHEARKQIHDEAIANGEIARAMPSTVLIRARYGGWDEALKAAGLKPRPKAGRTVPKPERISEAECDDAIRQATLDTGQPLTAQSYVRWRAEKIAASKDAPVGPLPSIETLTKRYGGTAGIRHRASELLGDQVPSGNPEVDRHE